MKNLLFLLLFFPHLIFAQTAVVDKNATGWKAGTSRIAITPKESLWMAGFASRTEPGKGKLHDLWIKALALEDHNGNKAVLVTADLLGLPKELSDKIRQEFEKQFGLTKAQIILNSSHTHSGPVLDNALFDIYPLDDTQRASVRQYSELLVGQMVTLVGEALDKLEPATVYAENGVARFQVNRRNNDASTLSSATELNGPSDAAVPVLKVMDKEDKLLAIAFGYACHPTVLGGYEWSGDYPGFAQIELEELYPGANALFFQGAGGDQNPLPRHTIPLAKQYGKELAAAVERVLSEDMRKLEPELSTAYSEVDLPLTPAPTIEEFEKYINSSTGYQQRWAKRLQGQLKEGQNLPTSHPYPVQVWKLGDQPIMTLGGELVVGYAIALKRIFGQHTFVMGYSNDVVSYIPTAKILREGGYEGATAQMVYGLPSTWGADSESLILGELVSLGKKTGITQPEEKLIEP